MDDFYLLGVVGVRVRVRHGLSIYALDFVEDSREKRCRNGGNVPSLKEREEKTTARQRKRG